MSQLMDEYDGLRDAARTVQDFYRGFPTTQAALDAFRTAYAARDATSDIMVRVDPARFKLSRFFVGMRKLSRAGFLSRRIVWLAMQRAAIEDVFLAQIDPLDQVIAESAHGRRNVSDRDFYRELLAEFQAQGSTTSPS
jgi:hypothetical protein